VAIAAVVYLLRRPRPPARMRPLPSVASAAVLGALAALAIRTMLFGSGADGDQGAPPEVDILRLGLMSALTIVCEESVYRGVVQRAMEDLLARRRWGRVGAAATTVLLAAVATILAAAVPLRAAGDRRAILMGAIGTVVVVHTSAALVRAITGRAIAAGFARAIAAAATLAPFVASATQKVRLP